MINIMMQSKLVNTFRLGESKAHRGHCLDSV